MGLSGYFLHLSSSGSLEVTNKGNHVKSKCPRMRIREDECTRGSRKRQVEGHYEKHIKVHNKLLQVFTILTLEIVIAIILYSTESLGLNTLFVYTAED